MTQNRSRRPLRRFVAATFSFTIGFAIIFLIIALIAGWPLRTGRRAAAEPVDIDRSRQRSHTVASAAIPPVRLDEAAVTPRPAAPATSPTTPAFMPLTDDLRRKLADSYKMTVDVGFAHPAGELILLPDRQPVALSVKIEPSATLLAGFTEAGRQVEWSADAGTLRSAEPSTLSTTLKLPEGSRAIAVRAKVEVELTRSAAAGPGRELAGPKTENVSIEREVDVRLLAPVSSSLMKDGVLDGFKIGHYIPPPKPAKPGEVVKSNFPRRYPDRYQRPAFFYKVTPELKGLEVAPHLPLGTFEIDFPWKSLGSTQYIALDPNLVQKLADLLEQLQRDGVKVTHFVPIYGFRPPSFNIISIDENPGTNLKAVYSMHQYGRAIDLIVDEDGNNIIDDLNHDGQIDMRDPAVIMRAADKLDHAYATQGRMGLVGGAGLYWRNDFIERAKMLGCQTPYIHIDTRGFLGASGNLIRWWEPEEKPAPTHRIARTTDTHTVAKAKKAKPAIAQTAPKTAASSAAPPAPGKGAASAQTAAVQTAPFKTVPFKTPSVAVRAAAKPAALPTVPAID